MLKIPFHVKTPYVALALNYHLPKYFANVWNNASVRAAADGGANRIHSFFNKGNYKVPDYVSGDFDSIKKDVKVFLEKNGTKLIQTPNQDYSDVQKALNLINQKFNKMPVVVLGGYGGRFDQTIGVLNAALWCEKLDVFLMDQTNIMTWIRPKHSGVQLPEKWVPVKCGLLPMATPVSQLRTKGLKYEINDSLELGNHISIRNTAQTPNVSIITSHPVLWTNEIPKDENFL